MEQIWCVNLIPVKIKVNNKQSYKCYFLKLEKM